MKKHLRKKDMQGNAGSDAQKEKETASPIFHVFSILFFLLFFFSDSSEVFPFNTSPGEMQKGNKK